MTLLGHDLDQPNVWDVLLIVGGMNSRSADFWAGPMGDAVDGLRDRSTFLIDGAHPWSVDRLSFGITDDGILCLRRNPRNRSIRPLAHCLCGCMHGRNYRHWCLRSVHGPGIQPEDSRRRALFPLIVDSHVRPNCRTRPFQSRVPRWVRRMKSTEPGKWVTVSTMPPSRQ